MDWQPISTAPQSGRDVLVCTTYEVDGRDHHVLWVDSLWEGEWLHFPRMIHAPCTPTHWMPLPNPPQQE